MKVTIMYLGIFLLATCSPEKITYDGAEFAPKQVIWCYFTPGEQINNLRLYASVSINEPKLAFHKIPGAEVSLYDSKGKIEDLTYKDSVYVSNHIIDGKETYRIVSKASDYPTLSVNSSIPTDFEKGDVTVTEKSDHFFLTVKDNGKEENYYFLYMRAFYKGEWSRFQYFQSFDPVLDYHKSIDARLSGKATFLFNEVTFSDKSFNGKSHDIRIEKVGYPKENYELYDDTDNVDSLDFRVRKITKDAYYYEYTRRKQETVIKDAIGGEPAPVYSAVEGGYGIFGGYQEIQVKIKTEFKPVFRIKIY